MRAILALILIGSVNCLPQRLPLACRTQCGMRMDLSYAEPGTAWTCESLQAQETRALYALAVHAKAAPGLENPSLYCIRLADFIIIPHDTVTWKHRNIDVSGLTRCDLRLIEVGSSAPGQSALTHELAHAIQGCYSGDSADPHAGWSMNGIKRAIDAAWE